MEEISSVRFKESSDEVLKILNQAIKTGEAYSLKVSHSGGENIICKAIIKSFCVDAEGLLIKFVGITSDGLPMKIYTLGETE